MTGEFARPPTVPVTGTSGAGNAADEFGSRLEVGRVEARTNWSSDAGRNRTKLWNRT